jgi:hypothetical protein
MKPLRVLITNIALSGRSGTETVARDLAIGLMRRGHLPILYSPLLQLPGNAPGVMSEIREAHIPVTDDLNTITVRPDLIHGSHLHETMTACLYFPDVPAVWTCHSWDGPHDKVPPITNIKRFIAIDESCMERLLCEESINPEQTQLILNFANLEKFKQRKALPKKPKKALVLSHYAYADSLWYQNILEACKQAGLTVETYGSGIGKTCTNPEKLFLENDIVFAIDRTALEATAAGCAVVIVGQPGLGSMVKSNECELLYKRNFGRKSSTKQATIENILDEIKKYDPLDTQKACEYVRQQADADKYLDKVIALYESVLSNPSDVQVLSSADTTKLLKIASDYCANLSIAVRNHILGNTEIEKLQHQMADAGIILEKRNRQLEEYRHELEKVEQSRQNLKMDLNKSLSESELLSQHKNLQLQQIEALEQNLKRVNDELNSIKGSKTMIVKDRIFRVLKAK